MRFKLSKNKKLKEDLNKLEEQRKYVYNTISEKQKNIKLESESLLSLNKSKNQYDYYHALYKDVTPESVNNMSNEEFNVFIKPLNSLIISGSGYRDLYDESKNVTKETLIFKSKCNAMDDLISSTGSTAYAVVHTTNWFPNGYVITTEYSIKDSLHNQISFIKSELKSKFNNVYEDFNLFINKYYAFQSDNSKYQDLIGSRSMFFFKLIFEYVKSKYGFEYPRKDTIEKFIIGNSQPNSYTTSVSELCHDMYKELSSQDDSGNSVKLGKVSITYIETTFRSLINCIYSSLKARDKYYT